VLASASRVMSRVVTAQHQRAAGALRKQLAKFQDMELLLQIGEYKAGSDAEADAAIRNIGPIRQFLQQPPQDLSSFEASTRSLAELMR
jgi:type III secretion protein N (ATPase)